MAAMSAEEYNRWVSSLQLITDRYGNSRRGASVPCFPNRISRTSSDISTSSQLPSTAATATNDTHHSEAMTNGNSPAVWSADLCEHCQLFRRACVYICNVWCELAISPCTVFLHSIDHPQIQCTFICPVFKCFQLPFFCSNQWER